MTTAEKVGDSLCFLDLWTTSKDPNQLAAEVVRLSTEEISQKIPPSIVSSYLAQIGRVAGLKGGKARAEKLSRRKKTEIAKKAANNRWGKINKSK